MSTQEIVFWSIFLIIASLLIVGQVLFTNPARNVPPPQVVEYFPDVSKSDKEAALIYENATYAEKLKEISNRQPVYGLGEYSGPSFNENMVKDGALQTAYQNIIKELENKKDQIKKSLTPTGKELLLSNVDKIFSIIYQFISNDVSLTVVYRIWKKEKGQVVTYYILTIFDDNYAYALLKSVASDTLLDFYNNNVDIEAVWRKAFEEEPKK